MEVKEDIGGARHDWQEKKRGLTIDGVWTQAPKRGHKLPGARKVKCPCFENREKEQRKNKLSIREEEEEANVFRALGCEVGYGR